MTTEQIRDAQQTEECHVCPHQHVRMFDNFLRPLLHNPRKLFGPHVQAGMTALDVGCGAGFASLGLARLVGEEGLVIAADLQPEMLAMVKERAERSGLAERIRLHRCEADRIGVQEEVDFALAFWMLHEAPDPRALLEEIFGLLKPGGRLFVAEPSMHVKGVDFERAIQDAEDVGFTVFARPRVRLMTKAVVLEKGR